MVDGHGRDDADFPSLLGLQLLCNGGVLLGSGLVHADGAGVGLVTGGNGSGGGSGVGAEAVGIVGHRRTGSGKAHEVQVLGAVQNGAAVIIQAGSCLPVVLVRQGTQVVGSGLNLGVAHAVADEQKYVLGCLPGLLLGGCGGLGCSLGGLISCGGALGRLTGTTGQNRHGQRRRKKQCNQFFHFVPPKFLVVF